MTAPGGPATACLALLALLACACGCGRSGYELPIGSSGGSSDAALPDDGDAAGTPGPDGGDSGSQTRDLECPAEELLSSTTHTFNASLGPAPEQLLLALTLSLDPSGSQIGDDVGYPDGYAGTADFRPADVPGFADVVIPLMDGTASDVYRGISVYPDGAGGYTPVTLDPTVAGATVSLVRQRVQDLALGVKMSNGTMQAEGTVVWELWGCR